ncbi:MAG: TPP-dependent acetoin dehydrogenase complex, E3 component, dihydrolipoamide dehydrogenase, dihydrolipoamide dehydrogenase [Candidatus Peregrinibacteria bacterium GW2011_GWF2_33_10]|nr:MAG: TPP-dependent acetoin dehydrogenase complex, E3 component, dihydrolipoamide dehydrogenase, dihydrolipoamide dehydrogenase [Candidatus Peregrinibacteria bacterium GW2011_GWF2_33_10]OGJ44648.1 MAG: dihydrolipoyl dehydrogenase [Candidatus Peregrinibacteria bacterium RIFOXYA12_FULL_33_12]OGJ45484.1 MAG: dihydrolipoyl dehydrogenase [Candidatus Peregrinibacteria bacterium RIFOXYA2_FULL_33_21]OGJ51187.1 MAG: dihydrolipoyl dehydrogenase [Candidatus Peregrinibacteria bacterium RIFOXYB2_FULL_33_20
MYDYEIIIIGGGPGGTKCASVLAKANKKVCLIEKEALGGACLNRGCIPSKTYLYFGELLDSIKKAKRFGIQGPDPVINWEDVKKKKDMNMKILQMGLSNSLKLSGVTMLQGIGELISKNEVKVKMENEEKIISAEKVVLALGSKPFFPAMIKRGKHVITNREILNLDKLPQTLGIIGGGVIGVEMASAFSSLGSKVTIVEKLPGLIPTQDTEISSYLKKSLEKKGIEIHLNAEVMNCLDKENSAEMTVKFESGEEKLLSFEKILVAIGRRTVYDLNLLKKIGIENDGRRVLLNQNLQTNLENVYMIGDSAWRNLTAYGAEKEGEFVAKHILGLNSEINYELMPVTIFSHPEVGQLGLTEQDLQKKGINYEVKKSEYASNAKALIMNERDGFAKIIIEKTTSKILGVHIIGTQATEIIHQAILPIMQGFTVEKWLEATWSHPTLSEILKTALE